MAVANVKNKHSIITKVAHGWDDIEAAITAFASARLPFMMQGMHGNAKTTVGKLLGYIYGDGTFRYYDCSKANLITMAGFPDSEKMKAGLQAFIANNRSLIGSDKHPVRVILLDEITRCPKEAQNLLLEVIENRSIFGIPTGHEVLIATANPETYKGAQKLDDALLDRFVACLPIPDYKEIEATDVEAMIKINMEQQIDDKFFASVGAELKTRVEAVRAKYEEFCKDSDIRDRIAAYVANLVSLSKAKWGQNDDAPYISGREASNQLWRAIIALAAYYIVVYNRDTRQAFVEAAQEAIKYCWVIKHSMQDKHTRVVNTIHKDMKFLLLASGKGDAGKVQIAYATAVTPQAKLNFWETHLDAVLKHCDAPMKEEMMLSTLESIDGYTPATANAKKGFDKEVLSMRARLYGIAKKHVDFNSVVDGLEGALICQLIAGMNTAGANLTQEPFKSVLSGPVVQSSNIVDLLVHLSGGSNVKI
jgi:MoxR-like ATPase